MSQQLTPAAAIPLMHRFLGIGLMLVTALFFALRYLGIGPRLELEGDAAPVLAYAMAGVTAVLASVALRSSSRASPRARRDNRPTRTGPRRRSARRR